MIVGLLMTAGGAEEMVWVAAVACDAVPSGLTAVISARMAEPSSATPMM